MVHGEKCPKCGSKNAEDNSLHYTYEIESRVSADWYCPDCGITYLVLYKYDEIEINDDGYIDE